MLQLVAFITFLFSLTVTLFIIVTKIPALVSLPEDGHHGIKKHRVFAKFEKQVKNFYFDFFEKQVFLHKFLSKSRILILKIERNIDSILRNIRKKAQEVDKQIKKKK